MYVTALNAGLLALVAYALGILTGTSLVAMALARREASLSQWAAQLQASSRGTIATDPASGFPTPVGRAGGPGPTRYRWPVEPDHRSFRDLASFLASTGQPVPMPDTWR